MTDVPTLTTIILAALAVARITTLIVHDAILEPLRHELFVLSPPHDDLERGLGYQSSDRVPYRKRIGKRHYSVTLRRGKPPRRAGFVGQLLSCTQCVGVWVAAGVWASLHYWPAEATVVVAVAAVAQVAEIAVRGARS